MVVARGRARPPTHHHHSAKRRGSRRRRRGRRRRRAAASCAERCLARRGDYPQRTAGAQPRLSGCSCRPCRGDIHAAGAAYAGGPYLPSRGIGLAGSVAGQCAGRRKVTHAGARPSRRAGTRSRSSLRVGRRWRLHPLRRPRSAGTLRLRRAPDEPPAGPSGSALVRPPPPSRLPPLSRAGFIMGIMRGRTG